MKVVMNKQSLWKLVIKISNAMSGYEGSSVTAILIRM
jgi:hypothetical protein